MDVNYTTDKSTQMLIYLLKAHGIRKVVASPGTTNAIFVASIQSDSYFEIYSSIDERSAAYIACGLAESSGEPVVITCTEATASRNYFPGLTEAYYRKLPILAITGFHDLSRVGNLYTQVIDRSIAPKDTVKLSVDIETCKSSKDEWFVNFKINKAILELTKNGGGPVHINLQISRWDFFAKELSVTRVIDRITHKDKFPIMPNGKIAIVIGSHKRFTEEETNAIERFCETRNGVVFCSLVSGYYGKYKINDSIVNFQKSYIPQSRRADLTIHLGEIGAANVSSKETWRVSEDGEVRDTFKNLRFIFQMDEFHFFSRYAEKDDNITT